MNLIQEPEQHQSHIESQIENKTVASASLSDKSNDLLSAIPEEMRDAILKLI